jgi:hypothetical protein
MVATLLRVLPAIGMVAGHAAAVDTARSPAPAGATPRAIEGGGWVVQLSAQKTEAEAQAAFRAMQNIPCSASISL